MDAKSQLLRFSSPELRSASPLAGRYRLERELGRGGMGVVYEARDVALGRTVAVKLLRQGDDDFRMLARMRREARAAAGVCHPNTVPVYDVGHDEVYGAYLVMELVRGVGLHRLALPLEPAHAAMIGVEVCAALEACHLNGIIHRDLKRQNLMVEVHGDILRVRLMDFGVARCAFHGDTITREGSFVGTANYAAPEQVDDGELTPQTDLYSLGVILFELLTGRVPFLGKNDTATLYMHVHREPPDLGAERPDLPPALVQAVMCCLRKDPAKRPASAEELAGTLTSALADCPAPTRALEPSCGDCDPLASTAGSRDRAPDTPRRRTPARGLRTSRTPSGAAPAVPAGAGAPEPGRGAQVGGTPARETRVTWRVLLAALALFAAAALLTHLMGRRLGQPLSAELLHPDETATAR